MMSSPLYGIDDYLFWAGVDPAKIISRVPTQAEDGWLCLIVSTEDASYQVTIGSGEEPVVEQVWRAFEQRQAGGHDAG